MKTIRQSPFSLLLALSVVVWGCSGGGGSNPAAPAFDETSTEQVTADRGKVAQDDTSRYQLFIEDLFSSGDAPPCDGVVAGGSNCVPNLERTSLLGIQGSYGPGVYAGPIDTDRIINILNEGSNANSCALPLVTAFKYTNYWIVEKDRKSAGVEVTWDFFVEADGPKRWELRLQGTLADGDDYPPQPFFFSTVNVTVATFERGHGKSICTISESGLDSIVQIYRFE